MSDETLAQERCEHYLTIEMGNLCGKPTNTPGGTRATSMSSNVTCKPCQQILAQRGLLSVAAAREFAALDAIIREDHPRPGDTRTCPDPGCGRPQHYTGTEAGWCHDALVDTWHCADPRKAGA